MGRKRFNIGVDVDGVVSDFMGAARKLLKEMYGRPSDDMVQTSWAFDSLGITVEEERAFWAKVDETPNWWMGHSVMPGTNGLPELCTDHRVVFITNRKDGKYGQPIEAQTQKWLWNNFERIAWQSNVIISDNKGPVARGLKLDYFIDDRPKNVEEVWAASKNTETYLLEATYNRDCDFRIPHVRSLNEFIDIVEREANQ